MVGLQVLIMSGVNLNLADPVSTVALSLREEVESEGPLFLSPDPMWARRQSGDSCLYALQDSKVTTL
jgi:hypothetical protein